MGQREPIAHLTFGFNPSIISESTIITMSIVLKFKKEVNTLRSAVNGEIFLDVKNPKLYKKVRRYYQNEGVIFSEDPLDNYDILIECIAHDLETVGVI